MGFDAALLACSPAASLVGSWMMRTTGVRRCSSRSPWEEDTWHKYTPAYCNQTLKNVRQGVRLPDSFEWAGCRACSEVQPNPENICLRNGLCENRRETRCTSIAVHGGIRNK